MVGEMFGEGRVLHGIRIEVREGHPGVDGQIPDLLTRQIDVPVRQQVVVYDPATPLWHRGAHDWTFATDRWTGSWTTHAQFAGRLPVLVDQDRLDRVQTFSARAARQWRHGGGRKSEKRHAFGVKILTQRGRADARRHGPGLEVDRAYRPGAGRQVPIQTRVTGTFEDDVPAQILRHRVQPVEGVRTDGLLTQFDDHSGLAIGRGRSEDPFQRISSHRDQYDVVVSVLRRLMQKWRLMRDGSNVIVNRRRRIRCHASVSSLQQPACCCSR